MSQPSKGWSRAGAIALGLGGAALWAFARMEWIQVDYQDDLSGGGSVAIRGAEWSTETTAVALLLIVGMIAGVALRRWGRRAVGIVGALAGVGGAISPATTLLGTIDPERVHTLLSVGSDTAQTAQQSQSSGAVIAEWADITATTVAPLGPIGALLGCLVAVVGGVLLAAKPGQDSAKLNKYEQETVRREKIHEDLEARPDSGRVLWDALDADIDPTEQLGQPEHPERPERPEHSVRRRDQ